MIAVDQTPQQGGVIGEVVTATEHDTALAIVERAQENRVDLVVLGESHRGAVELVPGECGRADRASLAALCGPARPLIRALFQR